MIGAIDPIAWQVLGGILVAAISGYFAYRQARIGAAADREARLAQLADKTIDRQTAALDKLQSDIEDLRDKHQDCLDREGEMRIELRHLKDRVDELTVKAEKVDEQRKLKHDWRSFAGSLFMERETARRFLEQNRVEDAKRMMDETERLRSDSPLLDDLQALIERDHQ